MPDKLTDMAFTKDELKAKKKSEGCCVGIDGQPNPYPWGLSLSLEHDSLEKLGIKQLPTVGTEMRMTAIVKVTGVNQSAREGQDTETRVGLQITSMQLPADAPAGTKE